MNLNLPMNQSARRMLTAAIMAMTAVMAGCASAPSHFYTLNATATGGGEALADCVVVVGPLTVAGAVDRPELATVASANQMEFDEFDRWAEPIGENIASAVSANLGTLLGTVHTASAPVPGMGPAYHVAMRIEHFEQVRGTGKMAGEALVEVLWTLRTPADRSVRSERSVIREPVATDDSEALVAAYSRALADVSAEIAKAIRTAEADKKP
jgi:uncharacterized lipoprotein YmbA